MLSKEQNQAIYDVLFDYFESRMNGVKLNTNIETLADKFPDISKIVVKNLKRKTSLKVGNSINIGMMCNPSFHLSGEIIKIGKLFIKVKLPDDKILEFYTSSLNQKGLRDKNYSNVLFIRV